MVTHVSSCFQNLLEQTGWIPVVLAVNHKVPPSILNFLGLLERYNVEIYTFFSLVGEMGISP